ncbi:DUF1835 domain-containing protein [Paenibacillus sp. FSL R7-0652]|uniref:DUF1835 domain-containing protein n=1 Tax=Paenibacillus sp. AN1007 TaxID=3151385 RepID=A0AAU8NE85_9BACL
MIKSVFDFDNELHQMNEEELRSLLRELYLRTDMALHDKSGEAHYTQFAERQQQLFSRLHEERKLQKAGRPLPDLQHAQEIHIAIGESPLGSIKVALGKFPGRESRRFFSLNDYYGIGPLGDLTDACALQRRHLWLLERLHLTEHGSYLLQGLEQLRHLESFMSSIGEEIKVMIWYANNGHERTGLLYALHLLRHRQNPIKLIDTTALYSVLFEGSERHVLHLGELTSDQLSMMWEHRGNADPLSSEQRNLLEQEWLELAAQPGTLRMWKDDAVCSVPEDSLDEFIMEQVAKLTAERTTGEFINTARVVGEVLGSLPQAVGDSFIEYRVRQLILQGKLDMEGSPRAMRFYRVRMTGTV